MNDDELALMEWETDGGTAPPLFECYCGAEYERPGIVRICHAFHSAPPMGRWA